MSASHHKAEVGARLRIAIQATHGNLSQWGRQFNVSPYKLGNWLRGDNYPDPYILGIYCDQTGITLDWIYRDVVAGVASAVAARLLEQKPELPAA